MVEQVKLNGGDGNQNSVFFSWVGGWNQLEKSRRELSSGKILYLDWSGSYMDAHICQNSLNGTLVSVFYYM